MFACYGVKWISVMDIFMTEKYEVWCNIRSVVNSGSANGLSPGPQASGDKPLSKTVVIQFFDIYQLTELWTKDIHVHISFQIAIFI